MRNCDGVDTVVSSYYDGLVKKLQQNFPSALTSAISSCVRELFRWWWRHVYCHVLYI